MADPSSSSSSSVSSSKPEKPPSSSPPPLTITIRFAISLPDLTLPISSPQTTSLSTVILQIREQRPSTSHRRLRLIHSGKVLAPNTLLSSILRSSRATLPPPPPLPPPAAASTKGKAPLEPPTKPSSENASPTSTPIPPQQIFLHCSVGDSLTDAELSQEATSTSTASIQPQPSTLPQQQGFDRLLSAGFSETEIAALRSQFTRLNPNVNAEDLRMLEERWIDESAGQGGAELADGSPAGTYEDMVIGTVIGFFWPIAFLLMREDGVFNKRRQMAIISGMFVNLFFGLVRMSA